MCIGNHDYGRYSCGKGNSIYQIKYGKRSKKQGKKWIMPNNYYSFRKRSKGVIVDFFVLDTNSFNLNEKGMKEQQKEMSQKINQSNAHWKIVYGHHPWRSIAGHGNAEEELERFFKDLYSESPFDLYMCGHDHNKQFIRMNILNKELPLIVAQTDVGKTVEVKIWRSQREVIKKIKLGRLETSEDFNLKKAEGPKTTVIEGLKITVRPLTSKDIELRNLPKNTTGAIITKIENDSPINYLNINNIIIEAQKKKIKTVGDLKNIVNSALRSTDKTIMIGIYNNQNQKRYIGVKLD